MAVELPTPRHVILPQVPSDLDNTRALYDYLKKLTYVLGQIQQGLFDNDLTMADAINSGTSGTFTISSGGSIIVTSGIVTTVTS